MLTLCNSYYFRASADPNSCTASSALGLRFCAQFQLPLLAAETPIPSFPLTGDSILGFSVEKVEPEMEGYYLKVDTAAQSKL